MFSLNVKGLYYKTDTLPWNTTQERGHDAGVVLTCSTWQYFSFQSHINVQRRWICRNHFLRVVDQPPCNRYEKIPTHDYLDTKDSCMKGDHVYLYARGPRNLQHISVLRAETQNRDFLDQCVFTFLTRMVIKHILKFMKRDIESLSMLRQITLYATWRGVTMRALFYVACSMRNMKGWNVSRE
jgi:hypothetical protein